MKHILSLLCLLLLSGVVSADISGAALISDGDTITISGMKVRLNGIDTPERDQTCRKAGVTWKCGYEVTETLRRWLDTKEVRCLGDRKDRYGRLIADCFVDGYNLNARLVYVYVVRPYGTNGAAF
jgi:endonuclease YncB( thermonuclease family)